MRTHSCSIFTSQLSIAFSSILTPAARSARLSRNACTLVVSAAETVSDSFKTSFQRFSWSFRACRTMVEPRPILTSFSGSIAASLVPEQTQGGRRDRTSPIVKDLWPITVTLAGDNLHHTLTRPDVRYR